MSAAVLSLHVWRCVEWQVWGVTEFRGEDLTDIETEWFHLKSSAVNHAEQRLHDLTDEVEVIEVFSARGIPQFTKTISKGV